MFLQTHPKHIYMYLVNKTLKIKRKAGKEEEIVYGDKREGRFTIGPNG